MKNLVLISSFVFLVLNCTSSRIAGDYSFRTELLSIESEGACLVRAWGTGKDRKEAQKNAMKNAVSDIVFRVLVQGNDQNLIKPLAVGVNARVKHADYFDSFFQDNGDYLDFVSADRDMINQTSNRIILRSTRGISIGLVLSVNKSALKNKLISDEIIKVHS